MSQVLMHSKDNETEKQQINTTTLALKSIVGKEKKDFSDAMNKTYSAKKNQEDTLNIIIRIQNVINNLSVATEKLIGLETIVYMALNQSSFQNEIMSRAEELYAQIPDSYFEGRGGRH